MNEDIGIYGRRCSICGRFIGENNLIGIGSECFKALRYAQTMKLLSTNEGKSLYYNRDLEFLKSLVEKELKKKLRNKFKINFLNNVKDAKFLSKKQRELLLTMIDIDYDEYNKHMYETRIYLLDNVSVDRELIEIARQKIRQK